MRTSGRIAVCYWIAMILTGMVMMMMMGEAQTTCQTSNASPSSYDCVNAAAYIRSLGTGTSCCQNNCGGSRCTTMHTSGSCKVGICGACHQCVTCATAGNDLNNVVNGCQSNSKVGGFFIDGGANNLQFIVF